MGIFKSFFKKNDELERLLNGVANNAANNYKDEAQKDFKDFLNKFEELKENNKLNEKQISYYNDVKSKYQQELKGFHH